MKLSGKLRIAAFFVLAVMIIGCMQIKVSASEKTAKRGCTVVASFEYEYKDIGQKKFTKQETKTSKVIMSPEPSEFFYYKSSEDSAEGLGMVPENAQVIYKKLHNKKVGASCYAGVICGAGTARAKVTIKKILGKKEHLKNCFFVADGLVVDGLGVSDIKFHNNKITLKGTIPVYSSFDRFAEHDDIISTYIIEKDATFEISKKCKYYYGRDESCTKSYIIKETKSDIGLPYIRVWVKNGKVREIRTL